MRWIGVVGLEFGFEGVYGYVFDCGFGGDIVEFDEDGESDDGEKKKPLNMMVVG